MPTRLKNEIEYDPIVACVRALQTASPAEFILVGGAAARLQGHNRVTEDVDILDVDGKLYYRSIKIDLLVKLDDRYAYDQVKRHYTRVLDGIHTLTPEFILGVKIRCFYLRSDGHGASKQKSDLVDAVFWAETLANMGQKVSETCAALFSIGHYHALCVRLFLSPSSFRKLVDVGFKRFICPWDEDTSEQKEYYLAITSAGEGSDPCTVPLDDDWFDFE